MLEIVKDWVGNTNSVYKILGASNHATEERQEEDYYATEPLATELLCDLETFSPNVWECACGQGHISEVLKSRGYSVSSTDLIDRGYGVGGIDFFKCKREWDGDIITNPPYKYAKEFCEHALSIVTNGHKVAMFLKIQFLEGKGRRYLFEKHPPKTVYISSSRLLCAKNGDFAEARKESSAIAYGWFVWQKGYRGETVVKWFN